MQPLGRIGINLNLNNWLMGWLKMGGGSMLTDMLDCCVFVDPLGVQAPWNVAAFSWAIDGEGTGR